jgi:3'-5' exoribonuclease
MIVSHHGQLEFGSPKTPVFPEALLLHYLDDMDSKMECMRRLIETDRQLAGNFTSYSPTLERVLLKKDRYLAGRAPYPPSAAPSAPPSAPASPPAKPEAVASPAPARAQAPAVASQNSSPFGDKLLQAWGPAEGEPGG